MIAVAMAIAVGLIGQSSSAPGIDAGPRKQARPASTDTSEPPPSHDAVENLNEPTGPEPFTGAQVTRPEAQEPTKAHLLGSWAGLRPALLDIGIVPTLSYLEQSLGNVRGGSSRQFGTAGQFTAGLQVDLRRLTGSLPGVFQASIYRRHGGNFDAKSGLDPLVSAQSIQGRGQTWRIGQLWYKVDLGHLNVKLGRMSLNEEFNQGRCNFVSGYFCFGANTRVNPTIWPVTPVSQWAVRLQYKLTRDLAFKTAVYQYNPKNLDTIRNFYVGWRGATGVTVPAELDYTPKPFGLQGTYTLGLLFSNARQDDVVLNDQRQYVMIAGGMPLVRRAQWGFYFDGRQRLSHPRADGSHLLTVFVNASVWSRQSAPNRGVIGAGVNYSGLLPDRPHDEVGIGFGKGRLNGRITDVERLLDAAGDRVAVRTDEYAVEAYYAIVLRPGLSFQPDAQFIFNPAGDPARRNAVLLGFKTSVVL